MRINKVDIMDAQDAMRRLMDGNERYKTGNLSVKDVVSARKKTINSQNPFATIITCSDSRVCPELIFDATIGDLFVVRVAGDVVDPVVLGSIEYGVHELQTPVLIVLGHEKCGAATLACEYWVKKYSQNVEHIVDMIKPSVQKSGDNIEESIRLNSLNMVEKIRSFSPVIEGLEKEGKVKIFAMEYYFGDGHVELL